MKRRQWAIKNATAAEKARPSPPPALKVRLSRKDAFPELPGTNNKSNPSRGESRDRSRSKSRGPVTHNTRSWANVAAADGGGAKQSVNTTRPRSSSRGNSRVQALEKMVRDQQDVIAKLTKQLEEILNTGHRKPTKTSEVLEKVPRPASLTPQHLPPALQPSRAPVIQTNTAQTPHQSSQQHATTTAPTERVNAMEEPDEELEEDEVEQESRSSSSPRSVSSLSPLLARGGVKFTVRHRRLSERIDNIERRQNAKIDQLAARLDARLNELERFLYEKLGSPTPVTVNCNPHTPQQSS